MKVIGIIAEYNPFHNGHAFQIKKIKEDLKADYVVVAMSGDFVQRGMPAIIDKYARTQMALSCGADLVIELPVLWATASAEYFAMAGVTLFDKMGCVDVLCFGAETDDLSLLSLLADVLTDEPVVYRNLLSSYLKGGLSFPVARSKALCEYFKASSLNNRIGDGVPVLTRSSNIPQEISSILNEPNNILAIEYLKALKRRNSAITPHVIRREGAGYHDTEMIERPVSSEALQSPASTYCDLDGVPTASATAIRKVLEENACVTDCHAFDALGLAMPSSALTILKKHAADCALVHANDFSSILGYKLLTSDACILADIGDSNPDIANRILKNRMQFSSFEQFCELCKRKDMTYTRMSRVLLHLILNISNQDYSLGKELDYVPYLRILGFCKGSTALLKELKNTSHVPVISKLADASSLLNENTMALLEKDIFAADLYSQIVSYKSKTHSQSEYTRNIIRL